MSRNAELDELKRRVDCRVVLERNGWNLDRAESTAHHGKYRRGEGEIVIVHQQGKRWFDPLSDGAGDVIALAQHLRGGSIGQARVMLRPLAGLSPTYIEEVSKAAPKPPLDAPAVWSKARGLAEGGRAWKYLSEERGLPEASLRRAVAADVLREGVYGTVWALHRTADGRAAGWEMRGPKYKAFSAGGAKRLFWIGEFGTAARAAVTESAIDALSLGTLEGWQAGSVYLSTGGGFSPEAAHAFKTLMPAGMELVAATDRGKGGDLLAERLSKVAQSCSAAYSRLTPDAKDWNAQLLEGTPQKRLSTDGRLVYAAVAEKVDREMGSLPATVRAELCAHAARELLSREERQGPVTLTDDHKRLVAKPEPPTGPTLSPERPGGNQGPRLP